MISVVELDGIAAARLEDAEALWRTGRFDGASYLCGYAVEAALKARICRVLDWDQFPSSPNEFQAYRSFRTHDLDVLLRLSGQERRVKAEHWDSWSAVAVWTSDSRYNAVGTAREEKLMAMILGTRSLLEIL